MDKFELLKKKYEEYFKVSFPTRIIGFWDPLHDSPEFIETVGYENMKKAVDEAITNSEPIEEMPKGTWETIIF